MNLNQINYSQISANQIWYYDNSVEKLCRVKSSKSGFNYTTTYLKVKPLGEGLAGIVSLLKPDQMSKCKAIKFSNGKHCPVKPEYEISLRWPKDSIGLLLKPKAYFKLPLRDCYIMHKYDTTVKEILSCLNIKERIEAIYQLCRGVATLHDLGIAHCDIHLANVFYDKDKNRFDLGDFGQAISIEINKEKFDSSVNNDIEDLKEGIESILIGEEAELFARIMEGYKPRLNTLEDVLRLGFNLKSSLLIMDFMNSDTKTANEMLHIFKSIKKSF